jgi:hypothetical protein
MSAPPREATNDYSTGSRPSRGGLRGLFDGSPAGRLALAGLALVAIVLLLISSFLTLISISTGLSTLKTRTGFDHHSVTMLLLGLAAVPMLIGALRGARPAMIALAMIGIVVVVIALTVDLPDALDEGLYGERYEGAEASPGAGFFVETLGGVLLLLAGGLLLFVTPTRPGDSADAI